MSTGQRHNNPSSPSQENNDLCVNPQWVDRCLSCSGQVGHARAVSVCESGSRSKIKDYEGLAMDTSECRSHCGFSCSHAGAPYKAVSIGLRTAALSCYGTRCYIDMYFDAYQQVFLLKGRKPQHRLHLSALKWLRMGPVGFRTAVAGRGERREGRGEGKRKGVLASLVSRGI